MFSLVRLKNSLVYLFICLMILTLFYHGISAYSEKSEVKIIWHLSLPFYEQMQDRLEKFSDASDWQLKVHPMDLAYLNYTKNSTIYVEVYLSDPEEKTVYSASNRPEKGKTIFHVYQAKENYVETISHIPHSYFYKSKFDPCICMIIEKNLIQEIASLPFVYCIRVLPGAKLMTSVDQIRQYDDLDYIMEYHRKTVGPIDIAIIDEGYKNSTDWVTPEIGEAEDNIEFKWDFVNNDSSIDEGSCGHGTTCLDLLARAFGDNGEDDSMYADPNIYNFLKVRVSDFYGVVEAIEWCIEHEMDIVCMSWGYPPFFYVWPFKVHESDCNGWWCDRFKLGVESGVTWVAAAGNENCDWGVAYPAESHYVIAVGGYFDEETGKPQRWHPPYSEYGSNYGTTQYGIYWPRTILCTTCLGWDPWLWNEFKPNVYEAAVITGCIPQGTSWAVPFAAASIALGIYSYSGVLPNFEEIHDIIALSSEYQVMPDGCSQQGDIIDAHTLWHRRAVEDSVNGDINHDGIVDIFDICTVAVAFGSKPGDSNWDPNADAKPPPDDVIDIFDLAFIAIHFGEQSQLEGSSSGQESSGSFSSGEMQTLLGDFTSVSVYPSQVTVGKGESFSVNITVSDVVNMYGWEFKLYWNNTVLTCTKAEVYVPGVWDGNNNEAGSGVQNNFDPTYGRYWKAVVALSPAPAFNGSITIATLTFKAKATGTTSLDLQDTKLCNNEASPISHSTSDGSATVHNFRYMRSDTHTVNGLTAYKLGATQSNTPSSYIKVVYGLPTVYWGIRVWVRHADGTETELTSGTPVAQVSRSSDGYGLQTGTWNCTEILLATTDALVIRVYMKLGSGGWDECAKFATAQLGAEKLESSTWTINLWTRRTSSGHPPQVPYRTTGYFYWGTTTYNSHIQNIQYT